MLMTINYPSNNAEMIDLKDDVEAKGYLHLAAVIAVKHLYGNQITEEEAQQYCQVSTVQPCAIPVATQSIVHIPEVIPPAVAPEYGPYKTISVALPNCYQHAMTIMNFEKGQYSQGELQSLGFTSAFQALGRQIMANTIGGDGSNAAIDIMVHTKRDEEYMTVYGIMMEIPNTDGVDVSIAIIPDEDANVNVDGEADDYSKPYPDEPDAPITTTH